MISGVKAASDKFRVWPATSNPPSAQSSRSGA